MRIFCSFAYTGENKPEVETRMSLVIDTLTQLGHVAYCDLFDDEIRRIFTEPKQFIDDALTKLADYPTVFVLMTSERRSEGQLIEVGAALAYGKHIVIGQHQSSVGSSYVPTLGASFFVWQDSDDLVAKLALIFPSQT